MTYVYTLDDLYKIFQQEEDDKVAILKNFKNQNLDYDINWDNLIEAWS